MRAENSPPPDGLLADQGEVRVGSVVLRVLHTPGHSPGGVTLVAPGVAFCGDLVFHGSVGRTDLPGGSERVLLDSIRRHIMTLPDDTVLYPGHGPETTVGLEKRRTPSSASQAADKSGLPERAGVSVGPVFRRSPPGGSRSVSLSPNAASGSNGRSPPRAACLCCGCCGGVAALRWRGG